MENYCVLAEILGSFHFSRYVDHAALCDELLRNWLLQVLWLMRGTRSSLNPSRTLATYRTRTRLLVMRQSLLGAWAQDSRVPW
jgi:hypothetical protein